MNNMKNFILIFVIILFTQKLLKSLDNTKALEEKLYQEIITDKKDYNKIQSLIDAGVNLNTILDDGSTLLSHAAGSGDLDLVKFLLKSGANINSKTRNGDTPLIRAIKMDQNNIANYLIENNADINMRNNIGSTALHSAVLRGVTEIIQLLLKHGADINAQNVGGVTPLMNAQNKKVAELLINFGANVNLKNKHGRTIFDSINIGNSDYKRIIEEYKKEIKNTENQERKKDLKNTLEMFEEGYKNLIELKNYLDTVN